MSDEQKAAPKKAARKVPVKVVEEAIDKQPAHPHIQVNGNLPVDNHLVIN